MKKVKMNKKGNVEDQFGFIMIIFIASIVLVYMHSFYAKVYPTFEANLNNTNTNYGQQNVTQVNSLLRYGYGGFATAATLFPFFIVVIILVILYYAYHIKLSTPTLFVFIVIFITVAFLISVIIARLHLALVAENKDVADVKNDWEAPNWYVNKMPIIILVLGVFLMITLFMRNKSGSGKL